MYRTGSSPGRLGRGVGSVAPTVLAGVVRVWVGWLARSESQPPSALVWWALSSSAVGQSDSCDACVPDRRWLFDVVRVVCLRVVKVVQSGTGLVPFLMHRVSGVWVSGCRPGIYPAHNIPDSTNPIVLCRVCRFARVCACVRVCARVCSCSNRVCCWVSRASVHRVCGRVGLVLVAVV